MIGTLWFIAGRTGGGEILYKKINAQGVQRCTKCDFSGGYTANVDVLEEDLTWSEGPQLSTARMNARAASLGSPGVLMACGGSSGGGPGGKMADCYKVGADQYR